VVSGELPLSAKNFKDLRVWQNGMLLAAEVYQITKILPQEERYGLTTPMRRACVSVPSNIAEGHTRHSTADFIAFLNISIGSLNELETQTLLCENLGLLTPDKTQKAKELMAALHRSLRSLRTALQNKRKMVHYE
jgi:four helix bundle protein